MSPHAPLVWGLWNILGEWYRKQHMPKLFTSTLQALLTVVSSSWSTWSYSDMATQKMMAVTSSKQWIHFFRSDLWPPTSNSLLRNGEITITKLDEQIFIAL